MEATGRFVQSFRTIKDATVYLSASRYPTLSVLGPVLDKIRKNLEEGGSSPVISRVKKAIIDDLKTRYQDDNICELMNKSSLLDPRLKSLIHLSEEEQTYTIDCLVNEIGNTFFPPAPPSIDGEELS